MIGTEDYPSPNEAGSYVPVDFSKMKIGVKTITDAILKLGDLKKASPSYADKTVILNAIANNDLETMRNISNYFYKTSGIYQRLCKYMAYMYRYDWLVTPYYPNNKKSNSKKILDVFNKILSYLDNFEVKKFLGETALKVVKNGCYYGYLTVGPSKKIMIQQLPIKYCRLRYTTGNGLPVVEFNMKYFVDEFINTQQRNRILKIFPKQFEKGYKLYQQGKLKPDFPGDETGWYLLDPNSVIKFNLNGEDFPAFIAVIPAIIDLNEAQDLDRKKMQQQLLKILIQRMPIEKW